MSERPWEASAQFAIRGRTATLYAGRLPGAPLVVLNAYEGDGNKVAQTLLQVEAADHSLLVVSGLNWNHDMTPWACPSAFKGYDPYAGGADEYLSVLLDEVIPQAVTLLGKAPAFTCVAGYSLAGLFALYALYRCDSFRCAVSASGSYWFPGFVDYVRAHELQRKPDKLYLSLGSKEAKTNNPVLRTVQTCAEELVEHYRDQGLSVEFELNSGNHFKDEELRLAKGIKVVLS